MFLVDISYPSLAVVEAHVPGHVAWVRQHIAGGTFLFAGAKTNQLGGVVLVRSIQRSDLDALIAADPYAVAQVAEHRIIEFDCKLTAAGLADLAGA
jgi:uncharacterized protein YciI